MAPMTQLLSAANAPLSTLALDHLTLAGDETAVTLTPTHGEVLLYLLTGGVVVSWRDHEQPLCGRRSVRERSASAIRIPADFPVPVTVTLASFSADLLCVSLTTEASTPGLGPFVHQHDLVWHEVGEGTHQRTVGDLPCPAGYRLRGGETHNIPGGWSSWPAHATPDEAATRYTDHQEVFYVITPGYGVMCQTGYTHVGEQRQRQLTYCHNGSAHAVPLGAHEIVFSPGCWGWYAWFYDSFLEKTYNRWAHEGVKTYVR